MVNFKACIQAVDYIIKNVSDTGILDKLSILKLLFFAERYSLRKYGQSITNDTFYAMKMGPVASNTYDIISFKETAKEKDYAFKILEPNGTFGVKSKNALLDYDELSDSDLKSLDFAIENFGVYTSKKLVDITHKYKEWTKFEPKLKNANSSFEMQMSDFFLPTNEQTKEYAQISNEQVLANKELYLNGGIFENE